VSLTSPQQVGKLATFPSSLYGAVTGKHGFWALPSRALHSIGLWTDASR